MTERNFKEFVKRDLKKALADAGMEANFSFNTVEKMNCVYEALTITPEGSNIGVSLNMNSLFQDYENNISYDTIIESNAKVVIDAIKNSPVVDVSSLTDYSQMKNKLVVEVVSAETNAELLTKVPHKILEDMAIVYRFIVKENSNGRQSILVNNQMLEKMDVTAEQLHKDAVENSERLKPLVLSGMSEILAEMMGISREELVLRGIVPSDPYDEKMIVATVPDKMNGAGVLAYESFYEAASERANGDFYIIPSSIHELILVPDNGEFGPEELGSMVVEVNATQVPPEDKLTDSVYHYDAEDGIFELANKYIARKSDNLFDLTNF